MSDKSKRSEDGPAWFWKAYYAFVFLFVNFAMAMMTMDIPKGAGRDRAWWVQMAIMLLLGSVIGRAWSNEDEKRQASKDSAVGD